MSFKSFKSIGNPLISNFYIKPDIDLDGCILWLDGKDPLYSGVAPTSNTYISEWRDKSGLGNNGVANTPVLYNMGFNFTETEYFTGTCINTSNLLTVMSVCTCSSLAQSNTAGRVVSLGINGINDYNNAKFMYLGRFQSSNGLVGWRDSKSVFNNTPNIDQPYLFETWFDGTKNNTTVLNGENTSIANYNSTGKFDTRAFSIGRSVQKGDTPSAFYGRISEVLVFSEILSEPRRQEVEGYLSSKWNISNNLPITHPYSYKYLNDSTERIFTGGSTSSRFEEISFTNSYSSNASNTNFVVSFDLKYGSCTEIMSIVSDSNGYGNVSFGVQMEMFSSDGLLSLNCGWVQSQNGGLNYTINTTFNIADNIYHNIKVTISGTSVIITFDNTTTQSFTAPYTLYNDTNYSIIRMDIGENFGFKIPTGNTQSYKNILCY
jgi:hypothetical protein